MTMDEIIRLSKLCGLMKKDSTYIGLRVERFAALVAAAEREACAKVCEEGVDMQHPVIKKHIMKAFEKSPLLAAAIRARGEKND